MPSDSAVFLLFAGRQLTHLAPVDLLILVLYFVVVLFIGFYVKGSDQHELKSSFSPAAKCPPGSPG